MLIIAGIYIEFQITMRYLSVRIFRNFIYRAGENAVFWTIYVNLCGIHQTQPLTTAHTYISLRFPREDGITVANQLLWKLDEIASGVIPFKPTVDIRRSDVKVPKADHTMRIVDYK